MNATNGIPMYQTEDYAKCIGNKHQFCMVVAKLNSSDNSWDNLSSEEKVVKLNWNFIHRGLCLPLDAGSQENAITQAISKLNSQLSGHNVTIDNIYCQEGILRMSAIDRILLLFVFSVFMLTTLGTLLDTKNKKHENTIENILLKFSVKENWKKITQTRGSGDFSRLKCIQGIRVFANMGVIFSHVGLDVLYMYYSNPEELEKIFSTQSYGVLSAFLSLNVNIFFMISSFILTNQIYSHHEKNGSITFKESLVLIANRYFRLYIPTVVCVLLSQSSLFGFLLGVPNMKIYYMNRNACKENWIETLLTLTRRKDMCYIVTWYLSADFHAYILLLFLIYVILKYKLNSEKMMFMALMASMMIYGVIIYVTNMEYINYTFPQNDVQQKYLQDIYAFNIMYSSLYSTLPTSISGMVFGYLYFKTKRLEFIKIKPVHHIIWALSFFGLPALSAYLLSFRYNKLITAVLGSMIKVIFTSGFAIGIIGMTHRLGGQIRKFLEGKYSIFLGNISFSVYIFNYIITILSNGSRSYLRTWNTFLMVYILLTNVLLSILSGLMLSLAIEQPFLSIQKMILPQISKNTGKTIKKK